MFEINERSLRFLQIQPDQIQLNTLDRPGAVSDLTPLTYDELVEVIHYWGIPNVNVISSVQNRTAIESYNGDIESAILETIARRPCTLDDLQHLLGIHVNEINKYLGVMELSGKVQTQVLSRGVFYELSHK